MTVTVCDICGDIVEQNVKKPAKGVCFCGKCLGSLAAMVMERNQEAKKEKPHVYNAGITCKVNGTVEDDHLVIDDIMDDAPMTMIAHKTKQELGHIAEKAIRNAPIVPTVMDASTLTISGNAEYAEDYYQAVIHKKADIEPFLDECAYVGNVIQCFKRTGRFNMHVRAFISELGITKDDIVFFQEQDTEEQQEESEDAAEEDDYEYTCMDEAEDLGWRPGLPIDMEIQIFKSAMERKKEKMAQMRKVEKSNSQDSKENAEIENPISQDSEPDEEPPPAAPPEHKRKKRVNIDHGRVIALHNAGWPNWRIADELGASSDAITHLLSRARKAGENVMTAEEIAADKKKRNRII